MHTNASCRAHALGLHHISLSRTHIIRHDDAYLPPWPVRADRSHSSGAAYYVLL